MAEPLTKSSTELPASLLGGKPRTRKRRRVLLPQALKVHSGQLHLLYQCVRKISGLNKHSLAKFVFLITSSAAPSRAMKPLARRHFHVCSVLHLHQIHSHNLSSYFSDLRYDQVWAAFQDSNLLLPRLSCSLVYLMSLPARTPSSVIMPTALLPRHDLYHAVTPTWDTLGVARLEISAYRAMLAIMGNVSTSYARTMKHGMLTRG
jgi:hypothetical protein